MDSKVHGHFRQVSVTAGFSTQIKSSGHVGIGSGTCCGQEVPSVCILASIEILRQKGACFPVASTKDLELILTGSPSFIPMADPN